MKIETQEEFDLIGDLLLSAIMLSRVSDDAETKSQCTRCASVALEAMSDYLGGVKE